MRQLDKNEATFHDEATSQHFLMTTCAQFFSGGTSALLFTLHKSLLGAGQEKISKPCILSNCSKLSRCLEENLGGEDEDVAGGNIPMRGRDEEEEVGEVDQPGLVQRNWGAFECLHHVNNDDTMMTLH